MMNKHMRSVALVACLLGLTACAATAPPRAAYTGADRVGTVSKSMLVGRWSARILNPVQGEQGNVHDIEYNADGTVTVNSKDMASGMNMAFQMQGTWSVNGDMVTQKLETMKETSGNVLGGLMTSLASTFKDKMTGTANVYEATANRVVLVSDHGQAQELTRKP